MKKNDPLIARRRHLCQDMGRMAWPDEARAARAEIMAIDVKLKAAGVTFGDKDNC